MSRQKFFPGPSNRSKLPLCCFLSTELCNSHFSNCVSSQWRYEVRQTGIPNTKLIVSHSINFGLIF